MNEWSQSGWRDWSASAKRTYHGRRAWDCAQNLTELNAILVLRSVVFAMEVPTTHQCNRLGAPKMRTALLNQAISRKVQVKSGSKITIKKEHKTTRIGKLPRSFRHPVVVGRDHRDHPRTASKISSSAPTQGTGHGSCGGNIAQDDAAERTIAVACPR